MLFVDSGPLRDAAEQTCLVWDLVVALWGKLKEDKDDEKGIKLICVAFALYTGVPHNNGFY